MSRLVCGLGINDIENPVVIKDNGLIVYRCPFYARWHHMLSLAKKRGYDVCPEFLKFSGYKAFLKRSGYTDGKLVLLLPAYLSTSVIDPTSVAVLDAHQVRYITNIRWSRKALPWVTARNRGYVGDLTLHYPVTHRATHRGDNELDIHLRCLADKIKDLTHLAEEYRTNPWTFHSLRRLVSHMENSFKECLPYAPDPF